MEKLITQVQWQETGETTKDGKVHVLKYYYENDEVNVSKNDTIIFGNKKITTEIVPSDTVAVF